MKYLENAELWFIAMKKFENAHVTGPNHGWEFQKCNICGWNRYSNCYAYGHGIDPIFSICTLCIKLKPTDPKVKEAYTIELIRLAREAIK